LDTGDLTNMKTTLGFLLVLTTATTGCQTKRDADPNSSSANVGDCSAPSLCQTPTVPLPPSDCTLTQIDDENTIAPGHCGISTPGDVYFCDGYQAKPVASVTECMDPSDVCGTGPQALIVGQCTFDDHLGTLMCMGNGELDPVHASDCPTRYQTDTSCPQQQADGSTVWVLTDTCGADADGQVFYCANEVRQPTTADDPRCQ
jgi:hypothetical protein